MRGLLAASFLLVGPLLTPTQEATVKKVESSLLSPCCYSQAVGQHMSDVAEQMRQEIAQMAAAGEGETEIINHYKALYGERILIVPDGETGKILFATPGIASVVLSGFLFFLLRKILNRKELTKAERAQRLLDSPAEAILAKVRRETEECY